jgi:hypothetical protein
MICMLKAEWSKRYRLTYSRESNAAREGASERGSQRGLQQERHIPVMLMLGRAAVLVSALRIFEREIGPPASSHQYNGPLHAWTAWKHPHKSSHESQRAHT